MPGDWFDQNTSIWQGPQGQRPVGPNGETSIMAPPLYANQGGGYNPGAAANMASQGRPAPAAGSGGNDFNALGGSQDMYNSMAGGNAGPMSPEGRFIDPAGAVNAARALVPGGTLAKPDPNQNQNVGHEGSYNGLDRSGYANAWMGSGARSMADLQAFVQQHGGTINSGNGTVTTPYGEQIDMLGNARGSAEGRGQASAQWGGVGGPAAPAGGGGGQQFALGGGGGGFGGGFSGGGYSGGGGGGGGNSGGWDGQKFTYNPIAAPTAYTPQDVTNGVQAPNALNAQQLANPEKFAGVSAADLAADPGMQFRLKQGENALTNKFAASGLRGAGQAQALTDYNQNAASQEYANVYGRKFGEFQNAFQQNLAGTQANNAANAQAYGLTNQYQQAAQQAGNQTQQFNAGRQDTAAQNNFANAFNVANANNQGAQQAWQGNTNAQLGQGNLNLGYTQAANSYGLGMANVGLGYHSADQQYNLGMTQAANSYSLGQGNLGLGWANYGLNQQGQDFGQGFQLSQLGLQAAGMAGGYGGQYAQNAGGYATGAGNAGAAAANAGGQAWANAFGGVNGGIGTGAGLYLDQQQRRPPTGGAAGAAPSNGGGWGGYG